MGRIVVVTLRIANCSGFYGDRVSALSEVLNDGPVDVVTGDYLAELTMLILFRSRAKDPTRGYATTFLRQLEPVLGTIAERGTKVVVNAGGLAPAACADAVRELAAALGLDAARRPRRGRRPAPPRRRAAPGLDHLDTGEPLGDRSPLTANAYLGAWGIAAALDAGAQVVVTGRVTDASLVVGPAASHFGWARDDWDRAGRRDRRRSRAGVRHPGDRRQLRLRRARRSRSRCSPASRSPRWTTTARAVITKHPGTGGAVTVGTVTAQLLYEIAVPVVRRARTSSPASTPSRSSRTAPTACGSPASAASRRAAQLKVCLNMLGGFRNRMEFVLTGLDVEAKAELALAGLRDAYRAPAVFEHRLVRLDRPDAPTNEQAAALLRVHVQGRRRPTRSAGRSPPPPSSSRWPATPASRSPRRPGTRRRTASTGRRWCRPTRSSTSWCTPTAAARSCRTRAPADRSRRGRRWRG